MITEAQAGGEVMTVNYSTCADMGYNALFGGNPEAAMFSNVWYEYNYNTQSANTDLIQLFERSEQLRDRKLVLPAEPWLRVPLRRPGMVLRR